MSRSHLHFVQSLEPLQGGGLGSAALQLHHALLDLKVDSVLYSTHATGQAPFSSAAGVREFERRGPEKVFFAQGLCTQAVSWAETNQSGVVHGHGFYVYPNCVIRKITGLKQRPLIYHPHGMLEPWILKRSPFKKRVAHWLFENQNFARARLWRALTNKEADQIRGQGITAPITVLPNGIDPKPFLGESIAATTRRKILFLGRLHPKKGLDLLVKAWTRLSPKYRDWEIVIAGPDENNHRAEIETQISAASLGDSIKFIGGVSGQAKVDCYREAELFVLPSYSEGFPMAVLEAMASAVPVVITEECNFPEAGTAAAGWLCKAEAESFTGALQFALAASDEERRLRGQAGRMLVNKKYTWSKIAASLDLECSRLI